MPELEPYVAGVVRGKKWEPPAQEVQAQRDADEQIAIDMGDEYEQALTDATQEEIIDLAGTFSVLVCVGPRYRRIASNPRKPPVGELATSAKFSRCFIQLSSFSLLHLNGFQRLADLFNLVFILLAF